MYLSLRGRHIRWYIIIIITIINTHIINTNITKRSVRAGRRRRSFNKAFRALHFGALDELNESMNEL